MSKTEKQSAVLAIFSSQAITADRRDQLIAAAKLQLDTLVGQRKQAPFRAVAMGMLLHQLKAGCKHGEWMPLYGQILKSSKFVTESTAQTYCSQWMRLATEFLIEAKAARPEFIALAGTELSLDSKDTNERAFIGKLEKFVDDRSLDELLTDLNLRNAGTVKKKKALKGGAAEPSEAAAEMTVQDRFNEIEAALRLATSGACDKGTWMSFDKKQHDSLKAIFTDAANRVDAIYLKTHGRNAR